MKRLFILTMTAITLVFASCQQTIRQENAEAPEDATSPNVEQREIAQASSTMNMQPEYAKSIARSAYIWGYPMVNMMNRRAKLSAMPEPGRFGGVLPAAPTGYIGMLYDYIDPGQNFIACPNQDVVYGLGFQSLNDKPVVIQIPEIKDRFYVFAIYNQRTDQIGELGSQYNTEPGMYLLVGPEWDGIKPEGISEVIQSDTDLAVVIPRLFMDDNAEDREALQPIINQVMVYPLSEYTGEMKTKDWKEAPAVNAGNTSGGETKWVVPEKFLDQLPEVLASVPPLPGEESMYGQFKALLDVISRDPELKKEVIAELVELDNTMIKDFLKWKYNGKPAGNGWNRSVNNAEWGLDYFNRTGTSRSNMFDNRPTETQYFYTDGATDGTKLVGSNNYKITFKAGELPPVDGFWSLTMYNEHHFFYPNELKRYSLGTKNTTLKYENDGSLVLYAGNKNPGKDKESNWLPAPGGDFSIYLRAYQGKKGVTEGTWTPPVVELY